jgi:hypothetical protein
MAVSYLRGLVVVFRQRRPGFESMSGHVGFVVDKVAWGRFSPSTSASPANSRSTDCATPVTSHHPGLVQGAKQWTSTQSHPGSR